MGELDFRKKRKNTNVRGAGRKQGKSSKQRELRFENEKGKSGLPVNAGAETETAQRGLFCGQ